MLTCAKRGLSGARSNAETVQSAGLKEERFERFVAKTGSNRADKPIPANKTRRHEAPGKS
ncbi:MAG TPA: hypothetical protein DEB17_11150 [Chlorobaculum sp.]|uniref:Uncharacterized protein n=1 Tax=Chlorobaculum tepidum (strain ATCC 49652 / DSM 12025 / NBRC 103806 / TLS) TaxID=194439 RepID=Q8KCM6_CHLTE|nr:hypothetical protein CT1388 [Chlorobaculum tepidum TLS]HBU24525.1 hypothetical protein [Chlorobaculum sp.]